MKTAKITMWGKEHEIGFERNTYANNGNLAIQAWEVEDEEFTEPYATVTVNLGECKENRAFIDSNNCPREIIKWLVDNGYAICTYRMETSGFCTYMEYIFTSEFLSEVVA